MDFSQGRKSSNRTVGIVVVVVFHALLLYGFASGLARKEIEVLPPPIETTILEEDRPVEEPPPPPPPTFEPPPPPFVPMPEILISQPPPASSRAITTVTTERPVAPPPVAAPAAPVRVAPVVKASNCRPPEYPAASERLGETGSVVVALLVGTDGKVTDSRVEQSSGFPRLDQAALKGLSRCRFTAGTLDGKPEASWQVLKYTFKPAD